LESLIGLPTDEELEEWIVIFPIEVPDGRIHMRQLPPPE
jgi:hypothetical protein